MQMHFYSKLVNTDSLVIALNELQITDAQKAHLMGIIDSSLYHAILDAVLSELSEKDKKLFLDHVMSEDNEEVWKFLNSKIEGIEAKIQKTAESLKDELHKDIQETKSKK